MTKDPMELGALWERTSAKTGVRYLTGTINGVRVVCFPNANKEHEKQPDWRVLKSQPKPGGDA